ncbi:MerR family transcriptional regulator [Maridesulfovibrio sp. FT414]|uniref:MerR family transcriptional regulator n=1 Tax=Maridesulfovibrio sp. FT414 TaxID=2979469 RepID=UPI003D805897
MSVQSEEKIYKIGQAAKLVGLKSYVLRFWEGEFEQLEPIRTPSGQRLYNDGHIALISRIKALLHDEGLTIEGARKRLDMPESRVGDAVSTVELPAPRVEDLPLFKHDAESEESPRKATLHEIHAALLEIRKLLS